MITAAELPQELVVPRWLSFRKAAALGELSMAEGSVPQLPLSSDFPERLRLFQRNGKRLLGCDLLGQAFLEHRPEAAELAKLILAREDIRPATRLLAERALGKAEINAPARVKDAIRQQRILLREYPRNPIGWVDLARNYAACANVEKARRCLTTALGLAPENRFVIRALVRFLIHLRQFDEAYWLLERTSIARTDSWVLATATSVARLAGKPSPLPKRIQLEGLDDHQVLARSELIESFGMEELIHGKDRLARKAFRLAWRDPSPNVVTHAEWLTRVVLPGLRGELKVDLTDSPQAQANAAFERADFHETLAAIELWKFEEPYSWRPWVSESYIHCLREDFSALELCFSNARSLQMVHPILLNNYTYSLLLDQGAKAAEPYMTRLKQLKSGLSDVAVTATEGLFEIAKGAVAEGKHLYKAAQAEAEKRGGGLERSVFLHKVVSLLWFKHAVLKEDWERIKEITRNPRGVQERMLIQKIENLRPAADASSTLTPKGVEGELKAGSGTDFER